MKMKKSSYNEIFIRGQMIQLKKKNSSPSSKWECYFDNLFD